MSARGLERAARALGWALLALGLGAAALPALEVRLVSPPPGQTVFGRVEVVAEVTPPGGARRVELRVDGRSLGSLAASPYRWTAEVGDDNVAHRFEVVAEDAAGAMARATRETPAIQIDERVEVELQQLYVTVTAAGRPVRDLPRDAFMVLDQGRRQELVTFERGDVPLTAVLLVDASESMRGERLETALAGARAFVGDMQPLDQAMLLLFAGRVLHATPFTSFPEILSTGLASAAARGGTALNDHLYLALKLLDERQGRRVLLVLSDGVDSASVLGMRDVLWAARRSQSLVYWLRLEPPGSGQSFSSAWHSAEGYRDEMGRLEQLVRRSGGGIVDLADLEEAAAAFATILSELRGQYVLGYYPTARRGEDGWRKVRVRVAGGLTARTRNGYVDN